MEFIAVVLAIGSLVLNVMCDLLSRSFRPETLAGHEDVFNIETSEWMMRLVKLCDPTQVIETEHDFTQLLRSATDLCDELHVLFD